MGKNQRSDRKEADPSYWISGDNDINNVVWLFEFSADGNSCENLCRFAKPEFGCRPDIRRGTGNEGPARYNGHD